MDAQGRTPDLAVFVQDAQSSAMCALAAAVIVMYDCVVSIDREIELVWKKRWSLIKAVYLWYRYFGLFCVLLGAGVSLRGELSDTFCEFWIRWEAVCYTSLTFISEGAYISLRNNVYTNAVLILWIWVAYNRNGCLLAVLSVVYAVQVISVVGILIQSLSTLTARSQFVPRFALCRVTEIGSTLRFLWIPILSFDSILLALFTYKGLHVYWSRSQRERFGVMFMVYRHTLPTFLAIVSSYLTCAVMWVTARPGLGQIPQSFALCFSVINCTRLLLNIRRAYYIGNNSASPTPRSSFAGESRSPVPISYRCRNRSMDSSLDLSHCGEIEVAVRVEVIRTCQEFGADDWQYEMTEMRSATI